MRISYVAPPQTQNLLGSTICSVHGAFIVKLLHYQCTGRVDTPALHSIGYGITFRACQRFAGTSSGEEQALVACS